MKASEFMQNPFENFAEHLESNGLIPGQIVADGNFHRCGTVDKPNSKNGSYIVHQDEPAYAWWKNWRTDEEGTWTAKTEKSLSSAERKALRKRIEADKAKREVEDKARHAEAAGKAADLWTKAEPADPHHAYLARKGIRHYGLRRLDSRLVVPVLGPDGKPQSLQFIGEDGGKRFLTGGKTAGGFYAIGKDKNGPLLIAEGIATAASLHEATGHTTLAAFNCGNLLAVARMARERHPKRPIIICCDNDRQTEGNPGLSKGRAAAEAVGASLAVPTFPEDQTGTDFNDMASQQGLKAVTAVIQAALAKKRDDDLPPKFSRREDGVYFLAETKEGSEAEWVCSPLRVLGATRDASGQEWGRLLEIVDADGNTHRWAMPMRLLNIQSDEWRAELRSLGLRIAGGKGAARLYAFLNEANPEARITCVSRVGWHGPVFVLPGQVYGGQTDEAVVLQGGPTSHAFRKAGTLENWQSEIGRFCVGNSRLVLAVCAALAGPALHLLDQEGGGVHFVGGSSIGKSTALRVGASCLGGGGLTGFVRTWRTTDNALEAVAHGHNDASLFLDEIGQADSKAVASTAYMLANGCGKGRASRSGGARLIAEWRLIFMSSGELTLADKITEDGKSRAMAGQAVRVLDVTADAEVGLGLFEDLHGFASAKDLAEYLNQRTRTIYGTAFDAWLSWLTLNPDEARRDLQVAMDQAGKALCIPGTSPQIGRAINRFSLLAAVGKVARRAGVLPWPEGEALRGVKVCLSSWLERRGGTGDYEANEAVAKVRAFIAAHGSSRFEDLDDNFGAKVPNRVGWKRRVKGRTQYLFQKDLFTKEVVPGQDPKRVLEALKAAGFLIHEKSRNTMTVSIGGTNLKLLCVPHEILTGGSRETGGNPETTEFGLPPQAQSKVGVPGRQPSPPDHLPPLTPLTENEAGDSKLNTDAGSPALPAPPTSKKPLPEPASGVPAEKTARLKEVLI